MKTIAEEQMVRELCLSCQDCKHFMRHYIKSSIFTDSINGFTPICRGHCMNPTKRIKSDVGASDAACSKFEFNRSEDLKRKEDGR